MELALISDVHGNLLALERVLEDIGDVDLILSAGDIVGYNPYPSEVIKLFREHNVRSVIGNHDRAVVTGDVSWFNPFAAEAVEWTQNQLNKKEIEYLSGLEDRLTIDVGDVRVTVTHGSPRSVEEYVCPTTIDIKLRGMISEVESKYLVLGHTHLPMRKEFKEGVVLNPGSVGQPRDQDERAAYCKFNPTTGECKLHRIEYDIDRVAEKIRKEGLAEKLARRLYQGR
ncbi:metallophosphoesterase family protein [Methanonatronarchaeum sp. AMET-Sl]|uniref:metallophosphoesterase family protein n=1 Tax=Methanonatronarchaeum sp. AMET-Sl TaxID=3037654 RepID=UPI00244E13C6|nr:metallophosphoesterase family protein [Methanonatronarchaeum sp. AMET-Sl]WGI17627.1 metallophosphoesterase family protein [Methanonatronarchaeum sp. AMET-Sl]